MDQLFEVAGHFDALVATIAALKVAYRDDPIAIVSLDAAEERIERAARLIKTQLIEPDGYDALPATPDNDNHIDVTEDGASAHQQAARREDE